ncbi:uncharacterized protein [Triticum aestivum]|uniref:uncharacterized protein n=1 Tax=Triticum aestivum TaxID=4565 RepID=UPI001D034728|nr:uncharacterized protein LOC123077374 [Triticum aestivum]
MASNSIRKPAPPPHKGREAAAQDLKHDLCEDLDKKDGHSLAPASSIFRDPIGSHAGRRPSNYQRRPSPLPCDPPPRHAAPHQSLATFHLGVPSLVNTPLRPGFPVRRPSSARPYESTASTIPPHGGRRLWGELPLQPPSRSSYRVVRTSVEVRTSTSALSPNTAIYSGMWHARRGDDGHNNYKFYLIFDLIRNLNHKSDIYKLSFRSSFMMMMMMMVMMMMMMMEAFHFNKVVGDVLVG